jgi:hypothetical protein
MPHVSFNWSNPLKLKYWVVGITWYGRTRYFSDAPAVGIGNAIDFLVGPVTMTIFIPRMTISVTRTDQVAKEQE